MARTAYFPRWYAFYEKNLIILTTIAEHGGSYCQRAIYNTAPFCHLPKVSTLVLDFGVCNSLLPPAPVKSSVSAQFWGWGTPFCPPLPLPTKSGISTRFWGWGLPSAPTTATTREIEHVDLILRVGDSLMPTPATTRDIGHDFRSGGLLSVSSTLTTCEIEHLGSILWVVDFLLPPHLQL